MRLRMLITVFFAISAAGLFAIPRSSVTGAGLPELQKRSLKGQKRQKRPSRPAPRNEARDYSKFNHSTAEHKLECGKCHTIPTANWTKQSDYPDITDYPDHNACLRCHRQQFFSGARPSICAGCHTNVSPKDGERFPFQKRNASHQFKIEFPHDKHQNVIATLLAPRDIGQAYRFVPASFQPGGSAAQETSAKYNNCTICHSTNSDVAEPAAPGSCPVPPLPKAGRMKSSPMSHASCFTCHYQNQQPTSENCAGCHKLSVAYTKALWPKRISATFDHSIEPHTRECTACHINITKASTLRGLEPDVPLTSCQECHAQPPHNVVRDELKKAGDPKFACCFCHTPDIGLRDPPRSHYIVLGISPKNITGRSP